MSEVAEAWAAEQMLGSEVAVKLLETLAKAANEQRFCEVSQLELSARVGVSERTIRKHLKQRVRPRLTRLETAKLISRLRRDDMDGNRLVDRTFLLIPKHPEEVLTLLVEVGHVRER